MVYLREYRRPDGTRLQLGHWGFTIENAIKIAINRDCLDIVRLLMRDPSNYWAFAKRALKRVLARQQTEMATVLITEPKELVFDVTRLQYAVSKCGNRSVLSAMFARALHCPSTWPTTVSRAKIWEAALDAGPQILKLLLSNGLNVNQQYPSGETPLFGAARRQNPEMVQLLLAHGARTDIWVGRRRSPLLDRFIERCHSDKRAADIKSLFNFK